jgi:hypothetical protein
MILCRVQHHPARAVLLPRLLAALQPIPTEVITDPQPDQLASPWRTYLHCLDNLPDSGHLLIVQDDALPCRNFAAALERIAAAVPDLPVCLFVSREARATYPNIIQATKRGQPFALVGRHDFCPVVATLWPVRLAAEFRDWAVVNPRATGQRNPRSDDAMVGTWMRRTNQQILVTVPSLVEHGDGTSLIGKTHKRSAAFFIGDSDPLATEWVYNG